MSTLQDIAALLTGQIPGLPNLFARQFVNKALEEVRKDRLWSWDINEGILIIPPLVQIGSVAVTQYSPIITFDATAMAALAPLVAANPPLVKRQFRVPGSPIYNIVNYNSGTGVMTLDRLYLEATNATAQYSIYRCYYEPPSTDGTAPNKDFLRYLSILNSIQGYVISGRRLTMTRADLNRRDPLRGALGQPYYTAAYIPTSDGLLQYELWPHPVFNQALQCWYQRRHINLGPTDVLPINCPDRLIEYRALEYAYRWAAQNMGRVPELRGADWRFLLAESQKTYARELVAYKREDNERMPKVIRPGASGIYDFLGPIDSNYWQSHGLPAL